MKNAKRLTLCGMLAAVAVVLSLVERMFPLDAIVPVPGVKLGLGECGDAVCAHAAERERRIRIVATRVAISSLLMGSVSAFLFSLFGGLLSLIVMGILLKAEGRFCSLFGVSVGGAAAHNIGQMAAAVIWLKNWAVIAYLPFLLVMSVPLGLVTGLTCSVVLHHLKKIDFGA